MLLTNDKLDINYTRDILRMLLETRYKSNNCDCITIEDIYDIEKALKNLLNSDEYQEQIENILVKAIDKVLINRLITDSLFE